MMMAGYEKLRMLGIPKNEGKFLNQQDILIFQAIVQEGNITKAANSLYMSVSTLNGRLHALEERLGVKLIERQKGVKTVTITEEGERFLEIAVKWKGLLKELDDISKSDQRIPLVVGTADSFLNHSLVGLFKKLLEPPNQFALELQMYRTDNIYPLILSNQIDVGLTLYAHQHADIISECIFTENIVIVTSKDINLGKQSIRPEELDPAREMFIGSKHNFYIGWGLEFNAWHEKYFDVSVEPLLRVNSVSVLSYFLDTPNFWAILPQSLAQGFAKEYDLNIYNLEIDTPKRQCYLLRNKNCSNLVNDRINLFKEILDTYVKEHYI